VRARTGALLAAAALAACALGGTQALWRDGGAGGLGSLAAGDLDVALAGSPAWADVSPGAPAHAVDPARFLAMPGDVLTMTQPVATVLDGENIAGRLTVSWEDDGGVPAGVDATYRVLGADGRPATAATALGESVDVAVPAGERTWQVVVELALADVPVTYAAGPVPGAPAPLAELELDVDLVQVRGA
jgi:alternate signal-mediated exported protein